MCFIVRGNGGCPACPPQNQQQTVDYQNMSSDRSGARATQLSLFARHTWNLFLSGNPKPLPMNRPAWKVLVWENNPLQGCVLFPTQLGSTSGMSTCGVNMFLKNRDSWRLEAAFLVAL